MLNCEMKVADKEKDKMRVSAFYNVTCYCVFMTSFGDQLKL